MLETLEPRDRGRRSTRPARSSAGSGSRRAPRSRGSPDRRPRHHRRRHRGRATPTSARSPRSRRTAASRTARSSTPSSCGDSSIDGVRRVEASLIGRNVEVTPAPRVPARPPARPRRPQQGADLLMRHPHPRHRRRRLHRLALRPHPARPARRPATSRVTVLDKLTYAGNLANLDDGARPPRLRLRPGRHLRRRAGRRAVAGTTRSCTSPPSRTSTGRSPARAEFVRTNVLGTQTLLDAALRHGVRTLRARLHRRGLRLDRRGLLDRGPTRCAPNSPYSASKAVQRPARPAPTTAPTAWTCGSPAAPTTTGRTSSPRRSSRCSSPTCSTARTVPLYGDGGNVRDWLHVDDHCRGIELVPHGGPRRRGLQHRRRHRADQQGAHRAAAGGLRRRLGHASSTSPDRKGHDRRYSVDITQDPRRARLRAPQGLRRRASPRPSPGTATTAPGGSRSRSAPPRYPRHGRRWPSERPAR